MKHLLDLMTLPGNGIHTVSTGAETKNLLWQKYFKTTSDNALQNIWKKQAQKIWKNSSPLVFACPSDNGGAILRGANWGPLYARLAFQAVIQDFSSHDLGDIKVNPHLLHDNLLKSTEIKKIAKALYGKSVALPVSPLSQIAHLGKEIWKANPNRSVFFLGGDHSTTLPLAQAWCESRKHKKFALLHFDAHTDLSVSRLGIDTCFGTWAYHIRRFLPKPSHLVQVGIRTSAKNKAHWEKTLGVKQFWAKEVLAKPAQETAESIFQYFKKLGIQELYISLDVDVFDPKYLSCTGTAENDGLAPHHLALIIKRLMGEFKIQVIDLVEFAPLIRNLSIPLAQPEPDTSLLSLKSLAPLLWQSLYTTN